jgi:hypothetical protein
MPRTKRRPTQGGATGENIAWDATTAGERDLITQIVNRAATLYPKLDKLSAAMDIEATHVSGNPLRLADLLAADNFNFSHDVAGIINNIDRNTGKLANCFEPRFTLTEGFRK